MLLILICAGLVRRTSDAILTAEVPTYARNSTVHANLRQDHLYATRNALCTLFSVGFESNRPSLKNASMSSRHSPADPCQDRASHTAFHLLGR
jgi:hypothetical protein